jgi:hypothetical protein
MKTKDDKNTDEARLKILKDQFLGPESRTAKGEWQLWRLKLELLKKCQSSEESFQVAAGLLKRARTKNEAGILAESRFSDWMVWELYLDAVSQKSKRSVMELLSLSYCSTAQCRVENMIVCYFVLICS